MPDERSRALVWAGGLLKEIAMDTSLPVDLRRRAVAVARHFPTIEQIEHMFIEAQGGPVGGVQFETVGAPRVGQGMSAWSVDILDTFGVAD